MPDTLAIVTEAISLIVKATMYSAQWASAGRKRALAKLVAMTDHDKEREILLLRERIAQQQEIITILRRQIQDRGKKHHFRVRERLATLWSVTYFEVPRHKVQEYYGASRASLYRWLHRIHDDDTKQRMPHNKTPEELAILVWEIVGNNVNWGRMRVANQIKRLKACLAPSNGKPEHVITDQGSVFTGDVFREFLASYGIKNRYGAVGKHGSIAVVERLIESLKHEWLNRAPCLKGRAHLAELCAGFVEWYNEWRPHMSLDGAVPEEKHRRSTRKPPDRGRKKVPRGIERKVLAETRTVGYRLKAAA